MADPTNLADLVTPPDQSVANQSSPARSPNQTQNDAGTTNLSAQVEMPKPVELDKLVELPKQKENPLNEELRAATPDEERQISQAQKDDAYTKKNEYGFSPAEFDSGTPLERFNMLVRGFAEKGYEKSNELAYSGPVNIPKVTAPTGPGAIKGAEQVGAATTNVVSGFVSGLASPGGVSNILNPETFLYSLPYFLKQGVQKISAAIAGDEPTTQARIEDALGGSAMFLGGLKGGAHIGTDIVPKTPAEASAQLMDAAVQSDSPHAKATLTNLANALQTVEKPSETAPLKPLPEGSNVVRDETGKVVQVAMPGQPGGEPRFPGSNEPAPVNMTGDEAHAAGFDLSKKLEEIPAHDEAIESSLTDYHRYNEVQSKMTEMAKTGNFDSPEFQALWKENEEIKNRNPNSPGMPPAAPITDMSEEGLQKAAQETPPENPPGQPPSVQPEPTPAAPNYGIAARVTAERAVAGNIHPVEAGEGVTAQEAVQHGRDLIDAGRDPLAAMADFKKTGKMSSDDIALVRAHGEDLAQAASAAADKFGIASDEYKAAAKADSDWVQQIKPMQTEWHKQGQAMQGETEIDTGSFHGLARAYAEATGGKEFSDAQAAQAKEISDKVKAATVDAEAAKQKLLDTISKGVTEVTPKPRAGIANYFKDAADSARARITARLSEGRVSSGLDPADIADHAIIAAHYIARGVDAGVELYKKMADEFGDRIKPYLSQIIEAAKKNVSDATDEKIAARLESQKAELEGAIAEKQKKLDTGDLSTKPIASNRPAVEPIESLKQRRDELNDQLAKARNEAAKPGDAELIQRKVDAINKQIAKKQEALKNGDIQPEPRSVNRPAVKEIEEAKQRLSEVNAQIEEARKPAPTGPDNSVQGIWQRAKDYIAGGETNFDDIRHKIASDTGLPVDEVTKMLAQPKGTRAITDEAYAKMGKQRQLSSEAKAWIDNQRLPGWQRAVQALPKAFFKLATFGHGTVWIGTHASPEIFKPQDWKQLLPNYFNAFRLMGLHDSGAYHERMMQDLERNPNYMTARRAGLENDISKGVGDYQKAWMGGWFNKLGLVGNRGFDGLKLLRQDLFDKAWNQMGSEMKSKDQAKMLSDAINHSTGATSIRFTECMNWTFFAPRLAASGWQWMLTDPAKAAKTLSSWGSATDAEKAFALRQVKEKASVAGTGLMLLAANQAMLINMDSKQRINFTDPTETDFLKFKAAGSKIGIGTPFLGNMRLLVSMVNSARGDPANYQKRDSVAKQFYSEIGDYARSKLSPFAQVATDVVTRADFEDRPLPFSDKKVPKSLAKQGIYTKYSYPEYLSEHLTPIPVADAIQEVWRHQGMDETTMHHWIGALMSGTVSGATGVRIGPDTNPAGK